jgi:hypothetical protein
MKLEDPRGAATFVVRVVGEAGAGKTSMAQSLLELPLATDEDVARLRVLDGEGDEPGAVADVIVVVVRGEPRAEAVERARAQAARGKSAIVAVHASDLDARAEETWAAWQAALEGTAVHAFATATPGGGAEGTAGAERGTDEVRAALLRVALDAADLPVARARRAKRPYATAIVAGAALVSAAEGLMPGAAAFVVATQVGAITGLYYLYTGKWIARSQALTIIPAFASEAIGGSAFLVAKSFLPPTGVADAVAAGVAASMTVAMLGGVVWLLDQGYSLQEKHQLKLAFRRMRAKTRAERAAIARNRARWGDKEYWKEVVRRVVFA